MIITMYVLYLKLLTKCHRPSKYHTNGEHTTELEAIYKIFYFLKLNLHILFN